LRVQQSSQMDVAWLYIARERTQQQNKNKSVNIKRMTKTD
jgi:hypothetical protein